MSASSAPPQKAFKSNSKRNFSITASFEILILSVIKALSSLQYNFIESNTNWFSSPISSPFAHLLDNNYLAHFMAEGKSLLPCQPFLLINGCLWWERQRERGEREEAVSQSWKVSMSSLCSWTPFSDRVKHTHTHTSCLVVREEDTEREFRKIPAGTFLKECYRICINNSSIKDVIFQGTWIHLDVFSAGTHWRRSCGGPCALRIVELNSLYPVRSYLCGSVLSKQISARECWM